MRATAPFIPSAYVHARLASDPVRGWSRPTAPPGVVRNLRATAYCAARPRGSSAAMSRQVVPRRPRGMRTTRSISTTRSRRVASRASDAASVGPDHARARRRSRAAFSANRNADASTVTPGSSGAGWASATAVSEPMAMRGAARVVVTIARRRGERRWDVMGWMRLDPRTRAGGCAGTCPGDSQRVLHLPPRVGGTGAIGPSEARAGSAPGAPRRRPAVTPRG